MRLLAMTVVALKLIAAFVTVEEVIERKWRRS